MHMPLPEVEKQAEISGASAEVVDQVKAFARQYAADMNRPATTSAPATTGAPAAVPETPLGPSLPQ
jgi:hypothetical protein